MFTEKIDLLRHPFVPGALLGFFHHHPPLLLSNSGMFTFSETR
jgi:hypothetical protein